MGFRTNWNGNKIATAVRAAEVAAVQEIIQTAARTAAGARSGKAANLTAEPAQSTGTGASGRWGLFPEPHGDPHWELMVETGTAYQAGDNAKRRAMDQHYPRLAKLIRSHRGQ